MYNRILSLAPSNTEILFALGAQDRIVGVTNLCDYPPTAAQLPRLGSWIQQQDTTAFSRLNPDLILTSMFVPPTVKTWTAQNNVKLVNVYPQTLGGIYDSILEIGELTQKDDAADKLVAEMRAQFQRIQSNVRNLQARPRIYTEEYHLPPTVAANWVPELILVTGGTPMTKPGILSHEVTAEQVTQFDPSLIVLHWCGFGEKQNPQLVLNRQGWQRIPAVQLRKIAIIHDSLLNRPGPRIWQGAEAIQRLIHKL